MINRELIFNIESKLAAGTSLFMGGIAVEALKAGDYNTVAIFGALAVSEAGAALVMHSDTNASTANSPDTD
jgi:hypothetical protein